MAKEQPGDARPQAAIAPLESSFLYEMSADLTPFDDLGVTPYGRRQICGIASGWFAGPRMRGTILPVGGEWALTRNDRASRLDVRITFKTDDGALIYVTYNGIMHGSKEVLREAFAKGTADPAAYYFRSTPYFETGAEQYAWLNRMVTVGIGRLKPGSRVEYTVHEIK